MSQIIDIINEIIHTITAIIPKIEKKSNPTAMINDMRDNIFSPRSSHIRAVVLWKRLQINNMINIKNSNDFI